jgi:hypothetical protein
MGTGNQTPEHDHPAIRRVPDRTVSSKFVGTTLGHQQFRLDPAWFQGKVVPDFGWIHAVFTSHN